MVNVGIFWVVDDEILFATEEKDESKIFKVSALTGKIDSDFEHYVMWDKLSKDKYPLSDFATYPRGRVIYDIKENKHIIYHDKCITKKQLDEIAKSFKIESVTFALDEHYRCDECMKGK